MPNTLTGLFQTLVLPATAELNRPLAFRNSMLSKIYIQDEPQAGGFGQTINVNIPVVNENDVVDIGNGPIQITDEDQATVSLIVNNNKSKAFRIPDFDKVRTPMDLRRLYLAPAIESVSRKINRSICNLVTTTNFSTYSSVVGGAAVFSRPNVAKAWANLVGSGVPMDPADLHIVTHHVPYSNMLSDPAQNWIQQNFVGTDAAAMAQQTARLVPAFTASFDYDQQFLQPTGTTYAGLFFHRSAIAAIPVLPPSERKPHVEETYYSPPGSGFVYRIQFWYDPREQAYILHVHCIYALTVVRPNFGSYLVTT